MARAALAIALLTLGCQAELSADLQEAAADEMVLVLDEAGIAAERERDEGPRRSPRYRVLVARGDIPRALAVLRDNDLPRPEEPGYAALFEGAGLIPSASEERARREAALGTELARSLEAMDAVRRARVHVALADPMSRPLDEAPPRARASVLVTHRPGVTVDEEAVRALVAGAVAELSRADVAIVSSETEAPVPREPDLVWVGPIAVTRSTATALKAILGGSFALNLVLAVVLILARRHRS